MTDRLIRFLAVVAVAIALFWGVLWAINDVPPAAAPDWITAIATAAALMFAAVAAWATLGQLKVLRDEAEARARDARSQQARLIYWSEDGGFRWYNVSREPVLQVTVIINAPGRDSTIVTFGDLHPTGRSGRPVEFVVALLVQLRKRWELQRFELADHTEGFFGAAAVSAALLFTDAGGRRWLRDKHLRLSEVDPHGEIEALLDPEVVERKPDLSDRFDVGRFLGEVARDIAASGDPRPSSVRQTSR